MLLSPICEQTPLFARSHSKLLRHGRGQSPLMTPYDPLMAPQNPHIGALQSRRWGGQLLDMTGCGYVGGLGGRGGVDQLFPIVKVGPKTTNLEPLPKIEIWEFHQKGPSWRWLGPWASQKWSRVGEAVAEQKVFPLSIAFAHSKRGSKVKTREKCKRGFGRLWASSMYLYVSLCISMYLYVSLCIKNLKFAM